MHHDISLVIYWILGIMVVGLIFLGIIMVICKFRGMAVPDLRDLIVEEYGEDFASDIYDKINEGIPVGNLETTKAYLDMIDDVKLKYRWK